MGRPAISDAQKIVTWGASLPPDLEQELLEIIDRTKLSKGKLAGLFIARGLAAYKRDGLLEEPEVIAARANARMVKRPVKENLPEEMTITVPVVKESKRKR
jgi:hypothetical protein